MAGLEASSRENLAEKPSQEITLSIGIMQKGSSLSKVRQKLYQRKYFLSDDMTSIRWDPSKKRFEESKLLVADIKEIVLV